MLSPRIWQTYALILVLIFGTLTKSWATGNLADEPRRFTSLATIIKASFLPTLNRGVGAYWMSQGELVPAHRNLIDHLIELPSEEKARLRLQIHKGSTLPNQPLTRRFKSYLLLVLEDEAEWTTLASQFETPTEIHNLALEILPRLGARLSPELRDKILKIVTRNYRSLSKRSEGPYKLTLPPKRMADVYLKHLLHGDELIQSMIEQGVAPAKAFLAYVMRVQDYVKADGLYSGEQVLSILEIMQSHLVDQVIYVGGSLTNGKAVRQTSDMDVIPEIGDFERSLEAMEESLRSSFASLSKCEMILQKIAEKDPLAFFGEKQTVAFKLDGRTIEMIVYQSNGEHKTYPLGDLPSRTVRSQRSFFIQTK